MLYHFSGRTNVWGGRAGCGALCGVCVEDGGMIKKAYLLGAQLNASPVDCGVCDSPGPDWIQVMKLLFAYWQVNNHLIPESRVRQKGGPPPHPAPNVRGQTWGSMEGVPHVRLLERKRHWGWGTWAGHLGPSQH